MEHKRRRFQFGWLNVKARKNGPDVWVLRYRETLEDSRTKTRSVSVGTIKEYPSESRARQASMSFVLSMNDKKPPDCLSPLEHSCNGTWRKSFLNATRPHLGIAVG
jgi:hypothetical protein